MEHTSTSHGRTNSVQIPISYHILTSVFSKWWPRWCLEEDLRWLTKIHTHYTSYTKWTGEEVNEVSDLQAAFALHIFQSDYESSLTRASCSHSQYYNQRIPHRNNVCTKGQRFHYVPQSFTLYVELSSVQLFFLFLFRQCQNNQHKPAEEHWETTDHTAGGFSNACSVLTQILLQLHFPFQWSSLV